MNGERFIASNHVLVYLGMEERGGKMEGRKGKWREGRGGGEGKKCMNVLINCSANKVIITNV